MKCSVCGKEFGNDMKCQYCGTDRVTGLAHYSGYDVPESDTINNASSFSQDDSYVPISRPNIIAEKSIVCYNCGEIIPADSKFCPQCGSNLYVTCPNCGKSYSSQYKICQYCGTNGAEYLERERKRKEQESKYVYFNCSLSVACRMSILHCLFEIMKNVNGSKGIGYIDIVARKFNMTARLREAEQMNNAKNILRKESEDIKVFFRALIEYFVTNDHRLNGKEYIKKNFRGVYDGIYYGLSPEYADPLDENRFDAWKFRIHLVP